MGKMVFMTFDQEKKKVKVISVAAEPEKQKDGIKPEKPKPANTWMKSKYD